MNGRPSIPPGLTAELLLDVFDLPISFHRCLVPVSGGVTSALMLSQAIWTAQAVDPTEAAEQQKAQEQQPKSKS